MVYRIYVEKKSNLANEAASLLWSLQNLLGIKNLEGLRIFNRYDVENIDGDLFNGCKTTVFSEPQLDDVYDELPEVFGSHIFAVEYLPGQYDQRADSAAQCIQLISQKERPTVRTAKVYMLEGDSIADDITAVKKYIINPVEAREAGLSLPASLELPVSLPEKIEVLDGFINMGDGSADDIIKKYSLAMDKDDVLFCRDYFKNENRDPTLTELKMIDTYWSDHCRHTTFLTVIDGVKIDDPSVKAAYENYLKIKAETGSKKPVTLMDIATIGAKYLRQKGLLESLDISDEINACTVKIDVDVTNKNGLKSVEKWLLLFKNETHNHPTEIEPFGGAATCIGGAIRDPLSGRAYVYQAMRITGAGDSTADINATLPGKLPQRKIATQAAAGYSSYGNQIGLATGIVDEIYHEGYIAKHMELGAVIGAAPLLNVRRETPLPGDVVILLGGRTGRDGCGGATGSSKSHDVTSIETCGAEVQKGNAPEERKIQRFFRNPEVTKLIKRCNDFGAGGVSVAIGELADGLHINLDKVPKKYEGLDGTELAISESQERMAVVLSPGDAEKFKMLAAAENLEATEIAIVKAEKRLTMEWQNEIIVDISRDFLNSNGAEKRTTVEIPIFTANNTDLYGKFNAKYIKLAGDLNICSKRGLSETFDSTIGAGTVLMPFGGKYQMTPIQAMAAKIPVLGGETDTCSLMSYGYNPVLSAENPFRGAYLAVIESISKLVATGGAIDGCYLTLQEYFPGTKDGPKRWGLPFAALLGALKAQTDLGIAAVGGKDSMSGSFEDIDVPPTLVSFAVTATDANNVISPEFKKPGSKVVFLSCDKDENGLPKAEELKDLYKQVSVLISEKKVLAAYTPICGGIAEAIMKMCFGNKTGFEFDGNFDEGKLFGENYGSFILELSGDIQLGEKLGRVISDYNLKYNNNIVALDEVQNIYENKLEGVYPCNIETKDEKTPAFEYKTDKYPAYEYAFPMIKTAKPKVLIPVFPGTNCEYDTARAFEAAGAAAEISVIKNLASADVTRSVEKFCALAAKSQIIFIPGGFSAGDEPDGSGKFITAFFRNPQVQACVEDLLDGRGGLMAGVCNGFQALIKLGLLPFGKIIKTDENCPTLTFNTIGRHQSKIVRTRIASNLSPWLKNTNPGDIHSIPVSHGEGRFYAGGEAIKKLAENGQIATQYVDMDGNPTMDIRYNPNGSAFAVEGVCSPDGRVFGRMGHPERAGKGLLKNVPGDYDTGIFKSAVEFFM